MPRSRSGSSKSLDCWRLLWATQPNLTLGQRKYHQTELEYPCILQPVVHRMKIVAEFLVTQRPAIDPYALPHFHQVWRCVQSYRKRLLHNTIVVCIVSRPNGPVLRGTPRLSPTWRKIDSQNVD